MFLVHPWSIITFLGIVGPKNTRFWDRIEYQCNMHELEWCQNVPNACRNLLIYGLYEVLHVSDALLVNYNIFGHFWAQNYQFWRLYWITGLNWNVVKMSKKFVETDSYTVYTKFYIFSSHYWQFINLL